MVKPLVVAVEMGYGHLRAALPLAEALGVEVLHADREPLAGPEERRLWRRTRKVYETISRLSQVPWVGAPFRRLLDEATEIPHLFPLRDLSAPNPAVEIHDRLIVRRGLGRGLAARMRETGEPLLTTFYTTAIAADRLGGGTTFCVVTDTDIHRIWAPLDAPGTRITYLTPSQRAGRRLRSYGVPAERIRFTGFPLPHRLLGGRDLPVLRRTLARRLVRLDPDRTFRGYAGSEIAHFLGGLPEEEERRAPHVVFAVGGAGAQAELAREFLPGFRTPLLDGQVRLTLVAGYRRDVEHRFREYVREARLEDALGHGLAILREETLDAYFGAFERLLADADVLWTKPSELVFYGALGLPLVLSPPVGFHERYNRRWILERGAGFRQRTAQHNAERLAERLADGTLAAAAWSGFMHLPKFGLYEILRIVGAQAAVPGDIEGSM
ncbi:MAG: hypothetical protein GYA57_09510 [Myxococcales bacterium]|nr:hypothetical protein [Myxococcales bacterium]